MSFETAIRSGADFFFRQSRKFAGLLEVSQEFGAQA
jgi:hypothetical protein